VVSFVPDLLGKRILMTQPTVTCSDYRAGRRLLGMKQRLEEKGLEPEERHKLEEEIALLEKEMGMD
jgi:hypothetical protein